MEFVTSMSLEGYQIYGETFLERAQDCLPGPLVVYTESDQLLQVKGVEWRALNEVEGYNWFLDGVSRFPAANGMVSGSFNYRFNVAKFCRKVFAQCHAASICRDRMWWIDADVEFEQPIPEAIFDDALEGVFMAYLGRPKWHSCLSLAGFDNQHEDAARFWANYSMLFITGQIFLLPEWHDSYVVDVLREQLGVSSRNMAAGINLPDGPCNVFDTVMASFANHKKGNIKKKSPGGPQRYAQLIDIMREKQPKRVLEIGTWNGRRAVEMNEAVEGGIEYVGFDLFEFANEESDEREKNVKPHFSARDVLQFLTEQGVNVTGLHVGDTRESLPKFIETSPDKFDLIFIDGGHSVETIRSDLDASLALIAPCGTIVLDDWYEGGIDTKQFGCNAVLEVLMGGGLNAPNAAALANIPTKHLSLKFHLLPVADKVQGGGTVKMVRLDVDF